MKSLLLSISLILLQSSLFAQNAPRLLLDGIPSGSTYTDSLGVLSVAQPSNYQVMSFNVLVTTNSRKKYYIPPNSPQLGPLMRKLPSGAQVSIWATVGCSQCVSMKISAQYTIP